MENKDIREEIKAANVCYWQGADAANISVSTLTIWMRKPMDNEKRAIIQTGIKKAAEKYGRSHA